MWTGMAARVFPMCLCVCVYMCVYVRVVCVCLSVCVCDYTASLSERTDSTTLLHSFKHTHTH